MLLPASLSVDQSMNKLPKQLNNAKSN
ncbi:hypothetical protein CHELA1G11_13269 [Hyphomicrobiales bacterium]|nr:hypothetical protein CHELA1G11_13269 [Hyphomicrobiales bacterium]